MFKSAAISRIYKAVKLNRLKHNKNASTREQCSAQWLAMQMTREVLTRKMRYLRTFLYVNTCTNKKKITTVQRFLLLRNTR